MGASPSTKYSAAELKSKNHISKVYANFSKLYEIISREEGNIFYSPVSAQAILSLLYQDAIGNAAKSLKKILQLSSAKNTLTEAINSLEEMNLHVSNKIFVHQGRTHSKNVAFVSKGATTEKINNWIKNETNGKIKDLAQDFDKDTGLMLLNAIYFKGDWWCIFHPELTFKEKFYISETETVDCDMMHRADVLKYSENEHLNAQILSLSCINMEVNLLIILLRLKMDVINLERKFKTMNLSELKDNLRLLIILPRSRTGIKDLESKLQTMNLNALDDNLHLNKVILSLPKFKIETTTDLKHPLIELGLGAMFGVKEKFPNIKNSTKSIDVNKVTQKAFIEVDQTEKEVEFVIASDDLYLPVVKADPPKFFKADHPFLFILSYERNKHLLPLIIGRINNPNSAD